MPYTGFEGFAWKNQQTGANDYVRKHNPPGKSYTYLVFPTISDMS